MLKGVIFDMDGTVTVPYIDWKTLRERIGAPQGKTIIDHIASLSPERSAWADGLLLEAERDAAVHSEVNDGVRDLLDYLKSRGIRTALVTNNHRKALEIVLRKHDLHFDATFTRDEGEIKPAGDLFEKALEALGLPADDVATVGDGQYDVMASRLVGVRCIYVTHGKPKLEHSPSVVTVRDVLPLLQDWAEGSAG